MAWFILSAKKRLIIPKELSPYKIAVVVQVYCEQSFFTTGTVRTITLLVQSVLVLLYKLYEYCTTCTVLVQYVQVQVLYKYENGFFAKSSNRQRLVRV
jgi:hypothetical protein